MEQGSAGAAVAGELDGVASFAQRRMWFVQQFAPRSTDQLLPLALRLRGEVDVTALARALEGVVRRHEVLRTRYVARDGEPRPVVDPARPLRLEPVDADGVAELVTRELRRPIDLATEPPLRATLARLAPDDHVLLLVVHHVAVDGRSWDVLLDELEAGYGGVAVPPPPLQYREVARRERERLSGARLDRLLDHWRRRLTGVVPLDLPTDRPRPALPDGVGAVVRFRIPAELVERVDAAARAGRATPYMLLLAVYQALLARCSGQDDIAVCTTLTDRGRPDEAGLIGPFVNTVVLRTDLSGDPSFPALLGRVRDTALADLSHAEAPFDRVVGALGGRRDPSRHPLAQASFTLLGPRRTGVALPGLDAELVPAPLAGATLDLFLDLHRRPDGSMVGRLQYATALFDADSMERFALGYVALLRAVLDDPDAPVGDLARAQDPLPGRARVAVGPPRPAGPATALRVAGEPGAVAVRCGDRAVRYRELDGLTGGLAEALAAAGVRPGTAVGVGVGRGIWSVVAMLAVWRAGAVHVPLDPALPDARLRAMVDEAGVACVVADRTTVDTVGALTGHTVLVERVGPVDAPPAAAPDPVDLAYVVFTSGSSGRPKAVGVEHGALAAHVAAARERFGITAADRVLAFSSFSFDASLDQLLPALTCGATVVVRPDEQWSTARLVETVARRAITVLNLPPTYWADLAVDLTPADAAALVSLRLLILGGEEIPPLALARWRARMGQVRTCNAYGPTETVVDAAVHDVTAADTDQVPLGRALGARRLDVVDAHDDPVPAGGVGELLVGGPELARGYLGQPGRTAERFVPDPGGAPGARRYRTGDLVRHRLDGTLEFVGRLDGQVKLRGFRIELGEVEAALAGAPGVVAAAAALHPDAHGGARLVGYVVPAAAAGAGGVDTAAVRDRCASTLPAHAVPARVLVLPELPVTTSGKLDRAALPAPDGPPVDAAAGASDVGTGPDGTGPDGAARAALERVVAGIWCEVLGLDRVERHDSFFDLGGHSLLATMAVSRIAARLDRAVELRTLFEHPRLRDFVPAVAAARPAAGAAVVPVDRSRPLPMSFAQERLWFLDRLAVEDGTAGDEYVLWFSWRVRGPLDRDAWQGVLDDVVARHEVLRTALTEVGARPVQVVHDGVRAVVEWHDAGPAGPGRTEWVRTRARAFATRRFDLARPPLLRSAGWALGPDDTVLVLALHHAATDGWSSGILADELAAGYRSRHRTGRPAGAAALPVQYGDYAVWQRGAGSAADGSLDHWRRELADVPVLRLPTDHPRPATRTGRGAVVEVELDPGLLARLDEPARRAGVSRFMVLLAAFQVVLTRWSGQDDVAVGTPVAGRDRVELERLVGFFVNTVVLRGDLSGGPGFTELLGRVRRTVLGAFEHQDVPFERLVEELRPRRDPSRNPLFQVMFDLQEEAAEGPPELDGCSLETFVLPWGSAKFDLTANFRVGPGRFALDVEYSTDLFTAASVRLLASHVERVLAAVVADPDADVRSLALLDPAERAPLVAGEPAPGPAAPVAPAGAPGDVALVCGDRSLTYAELDSLVGGLAVELRARGVTRGAVVGACLGRGVWSVAAMLAAWRVGAVHVPVDPRFPAERLAHLATEARVGWVVGDASTAGACGALGVPVVPVERVRPVPGVAASAPDPADLAYVIFTSGSSGPPKAVGVEHGALAAHVATARRLFGLTARDRVLAFASLSFDASLEQILPVLTAGGRVVLRPDELWSPDELARHVRDEGVTVMEATPSYWTEVVDRLGTIAGDLSGLRLLVTGGEVLPAAPLQRWFAALPGSVVVNTYGPTEAVVSATAHPVTGPVSGRVPIGRPLGGRLAHVVDEAGGPVPVGMPGELVLGGPELARGYLGRPARTAERFVPDPYGAPGARCYRTGDRVRRTADGLLDFLGRVDEQIKIRGVRIEPGEVEAVLADLPGVAAVAVRAREVRGDRALVAYLAGRGVDVAAARERCVRALPAHLVPVAFVPLDALPRTVQGKLDVAALPVPDVAPAAVSGPPRTPTETVTAQIWAEVLGVDRVGRDDDFFALGGHSLRAVAVVARIATAFDCPLRVRALFENPTVARLAAEVERELVEQIAAMSDEEIGLSLSVDPRPIPTTGR